MNQIRIQNKPWTGNVLALDLELNQPSNSIIQVGAVVGNIYTGEVVDRLSIITAMPDGEVLLPRITELTGITSEQTDIGADLGVAYELLRDMSIQHGCLMNPVTWGGGDAETLRKQLGMENDKWIFGRRWIDVKTLYVSKCLAEGKPYQGGLARSMTKMGLQFKGQKHQAADDALNTFHMYVRLLLTMRPGLMFVNLSETK